MNINDKVAVRLTPLALALLAANYVRDFSGNPQIPEYHAPSADADGWTEFQLWKLMAEFGSHCFNGRVGQLFVDNEVRILTTNAKSEPTSAELSREVGSTDGL